MRTLTRCCLFLVLATLAWGAAPGDSLAFKYVAVGDRLPRMRLPAVGRQARLDYLGGGTDRVRVFAFVGEGSERSTSLLRIFARLHQRFADRPVHWCLIVTDRDSAAWADTVAAVCPGVPALLDEGDALYGTLGVPLTPVVGVADSLGVLRAYLPYRKVNYEAVIAGHVRHLLGEIDAAALARILSPPRRRVHDSAAASVERSLKLARLLLERGKPDKALSLAEKAVARYPDEPAAQVLLAEVHAALGDSAAARDARARADSLAAARSEEAGPAPVDSSAADAAPADTAAGR